MPNLRFPEFEGEWEECTIGDYGDIITGNTPPTKDPANYKDGTYLWASPSDLGSYKFITETQTKLSSNGFDKTRKLSAGSVLVTCIGSTIGKMGMALTEMSTNQQINSIVVKKQYNNHFVYYALQSRFPRYLNSVAVQAVPIISKSSFEKLTNYKTSLEEQKKIGTLLNLIDERIATQNRIIEKYESLIYGLLDSIVAYPKDNKKYKLGELCEIRSGYSGTQNQMCKGLRVSRIETISNHHINLDKVGYVEPFEKSKTYKLNIGDILFSNINSVEYIGNTAYIDKDYALYHGMNLLRLIPNKTLVNPFYIYCLLNTQRAKNHFKSVCNKAVSQASINQTELSKTPIFIPTISKQENIARLFDILLRKREIERNNLTLFQKQKAYLLKEMFV